ncbi:hypothetical protein CC78DRAFT_536352 [Lojkania enalia]|uniref:Uncharacterized protein n=1 Tax=Lojkania enalia TaxID=147567 RepID=A0A9P4K211_9PLEO|nr:hypothetical protein CC78DRAFT_536352 [Didymosphaeria enalia]
MRRIRGPKIGRAQCGGKRAAVRAPIAPALGTACGAGQGLIQVSAPEERKEWNRSAATCVTVKKSWRRLYVFVACRISIKPPSPPPNLSPTRPNSVLRRLLGKQGDPDPPNTFETPLS